jgi:8-oxo-dGTP diphosphatase
VKFLVAVVTLIERDGHLLLLRRSASKDHAPGEWEPGSGRVEAGESPAVTVVREAREETGLAVEVVAPLDTFHFYRGPTRDETIGITFACRVTGGSLTLSEEHDEARWVPCDQLLAFDCEPWLRRCFEVFLAHRAARDR